MRRMPRGPASLSSVMTFALASRGVLWLYKMVRVLRPLPGRILMVLLVFGALLRKEVVRKCWSGTSMATILPRLFAHRSTRISLTIAVVLLLLILAIGMNSLQNTQRRRCLSTLCECWYFLEVSSGRCCVVYGWAAPPSPPDWQHCGGVTFHLRSPASACIGVSSQDSELP